MSILIAVGICFLVPVAAVLLAALIRPANRNKIICPYEHCWEAFDDPKEFIKHIETVHADEIYNGVKKWIN
jgi:hypothetical protein